MKHADALDKLRSFLEAEAPLVGDRLPSERDLAVRLGCSRQTLRVALLRLEAEGELWRHVGQGTFRGPSPPGRALRDTVLIEITGPDDLMDARLLIEPPVAGAAAAAATPAEIDLLRERVSAGRRARSRADCEHADGAFHRAVAQVAGNPVVVGVLNYLADARRRVAWQREWDRTYRRIGLDEFRNEHSDQHERIVDAIEARDRRRAAQAMRDHLVTIAHAMSARKPGP